MKQQLATFFLALAMAVAMVNAASLFVGERETEDKLACYGKIYMSARALKTNSINHSCRVLTGQNITYIIAEDAMDETENGGTAEVVKGGVGHRNVTLKFTSQEGQALDFTIKVYAKTNL